MKQLFSVFLVALMVGGFALAGLILVEFCAEPKCAVISSDTTWTKANSPYSLTGPVDVSGVTLTVESGVTINLNNYYIQVDGTLRAIGSNSDQIHFNGGQITFTSVSNGWNEQTGSGCIIENAILSSTYLTINGVSPKIFRNTFDGVFDKAGIYIDGRGTENYQTSPVISNNTIVGVFKGTGIYVLESTPVISNNTIINIGLEGTGNNGILCGGSASISDNVISGWAFNDGGGIGTVAPLPNYKIYHFIYPTIERNVITNNVRGLTLGSDVSQGGNIEIIQNNTIANNSIGLYIWSAPFSIIQNNNIQNNTQSNVYLGKYSGRVNATYNWWGTTDTQAINQTIHDYKNDFNLDTVSFIPFLTTPYNGTPPLLSPTPTPSISPSDYPTQQPTIEPNLKLDVSQAQFYTAAIMLTIALTVASGVLAYFYFKKKEKPKIDPHHPQ